MSEPNSLAEYLVISRGQWDEDLSRAEIQSTITQFYTWIEGLVSDGKVKRGQRLKFEGKTIVRKNVITDGPFGETKEVIGGFWLIFAPDLDTAVQIASGNPCLGAGLFLEIRPIDSENATPDNTR